MSVTYDIFDFPSVAIKGQVFYVPGAASEGGFTSGGAAVSTFEPGGYGMLDIMLARRDEFMDDPEISWLMSQANGQFFRVRLTQTPQLLSERSLADQPLQSGPVGNDWYIPRPKRSLVASYTTVALKGTRTVTIDLGEIGPVLKRGHLIGHKKSTYLVQSISYASGSIATVVVSPPLRKDVAIDDVVEFQPWFTGSIINGGEIRTAYESMNNGGIEMPAIRFREVVL